MRPCAETARNTVREFRTSNVIGPAADKKTVLMICANWNVTACFLSNAPSKNLSYETKFISLNRTCIIPSEFLRRQMLLQAGYQLDEIAWLVPDIKLEKQDVVPRVFDRTGRAGQGK